MKYGTRLPAALLAALFLAIVFGCSSESSHEHQAESGTKTKEKQRFLAFGGGPTGGTFNFFANKMSSEISNTYNYLDISPKGSGGSAENLRTLNKNAVDMGIVYSGDAFLGRNAKLPNDPNYYDGVQALAFLYGAPAQLITHRGANINSVHDLVGRTVAVGNPGSGAALAAERFFRHLGIWDRIGHRTLGYSQAAADFSDKRIDAFWVLVGYPNSSIIEAATRSRVKLVDLHTDAVKSGFYDKYPFYTRVVIPAGTYEGQTAPVETFQDAALWCASEKLDAEIVQDGLTAVFSEQGIKDIITAHKAARDMSVQHALTGISIPLHPGAVSFWQEKGLTIPASMLP
ncbi:TAXI family TRAP transporter solute-binding subunit [Pseudodesulfovibrio tunisiensis]|uniref:TAXI family TRAP transporter solute-binding subunit n=1 Tax=Pseudodesulfovibrio tunisiensis TaxID=463192 RepID=UPI001FB1D4B9|nr:TAXI family TRAP transporter solute-binding subunit [Pseudodesulfovibrio tunisiensis]